MSEVLARVRVEETHGIRRFLYPLTAVVQIAPSEALQKRLAGGETTLIHALTLTGPDGDPVPLQVSGLRGTVGSPKLLLDFAVSLAPLSETEFVLRDSGEKAVIHDPLTISQGAQGELENVQEKFAITLSDSGEINSVVYDGTSHLRAPSTVTRNGTAATMVSGIISHASPLSAQVDAQGRYADGCATTIHARLTACKSWATISHRLENTGASDSVTFTLPFAPTTPTLTYDFGVGNGVYGKLHASGPQEVVWHTAFDDDPYARWSLSVGGRRDYVGSAATAEEFQAQRWFHVIDNDKALAVAITEIPASCTHLTVTLKEDGTVQVRFDLDGEAASVAEFGVCYHFLNDIPAISAATNPQSILLPPTVEVLPA